MLRKSINKKLSLIQRIQKGPTLLIKQRRTALYITIASI